MIWFGKSIIKFCKSFINLIKLVSALTCSSARVRTQSGAFQVQTRLLQDSQWQGPARKNMIIWEKQNYCDLYCKQNEAEQRNYYELFYIQNEAQTQTALDAICWIVVHWPLGILPTV